MNVQSIILVILLAGAFLLAVKKGKNSTCSGDCAHCSGGEDCKKNSGN